MQLDFLKDFQFRLEDCFGPKLAKEETKVCTKCKRDLPLSVYRPHSGNLNYLRSECKFCENFLAKERYEIRKTAPPPPENHTCPICHKTAEEAKGRGGKNLGPWVYDHDHETKEFRGHLCHDCNRALGNFGDCIERMQRGIEYLKRNKKQ